MSDYKPNISISRLDTFEKCARYDHFQVVQRIPVPQRKAAASGEADHAQVEAWSMGKLKTSELTGAAAVVAQYYPLPMQEGVKIEEVFSVDYAGGILHGKIDLSTTKDVKLWGARSTPPKGLPRVTDLKTTSNLRWAKTADELDDNRQLLAYVKAKFPTDPLVEVSQIVVERASPYPAQQIVRIVGPSAVSEREEYDRAVVQTMLKSRRAKDALDLAPAPNPKDCKNWYGERCPFYDQCKGREERLLSGQSTGDGAYNGSVSQLLESAWAEAHHDGRGGEGTRAALDSIAARVPSNTQNSSDSRILVKQESKSESEEVNRMSLVQAPDASVTPAPKLAITEKEVISAQHSTLGKILTIRGQYADQNVEFRMTSSGEFRLLDQISWEELRISPEKVVRKAVGGNGVYKGSVAPHTVLKPDGEFDIDLVRKGPLLEALRNWPVWVEAQAAASVNAAPVTQTSVSTSTQATQPEPDAVSQISATVSADVPQNRVSSGNQAEVQALMDAGVTEAGAQKLVGAGITRKRLEAGEVSMDELLALPRIGPDRARDLIKKFKPESKPEPVKAETVKVEVKAEPEPVKVEIKTEAIKAEPEKYYIRKDVLEERIVELQQALKRSEEELEVQVLQKDKLLKELEVSLRRKEEELEQLKRLLETQIKSMEQRVVRRLYLNCMPEGQFWDLHSLLTASFDRICERLNIKDISQIKAYDLPEAVYSELQQNPPEWNALVVDTDSAEWRLTARYFMGLADNVVRAVR